MRDAARRGGHRGGRGEGEQEEDGDTSGHGDADSNCDGEDGGGLLEEEDSMRSVYTTGRARRLMKYQQAISRQTVTLHQNKKSSRTLPRQRRPLAPPSVAGSDCDKSQSLVVLCTLASHSAGA